MAENKEPELTTAQHVLDENENPSSLNISSSISTVNNSFNLIDSDTEKEISQPESQIFLDDTLSADLSSSKKNALVDSGFHCENLEKVVPDLVNNSLYESVDNKSADDFHEAKQVSTTSGISFSSNNDNSFNNSKDTSFNNKPNTSNITLLFERLTLDSEENPTSLECSALPDNTESSATSNEMSLNDNFQHTNLFNVDVNSNGSKRKSLDSSVSPDKNLPQTCLPDLNFVPNIESKVPPNETFSATYPVVVSMNNNVESLESNTSELTYSPVFSKASVDDNFKHPFPVPESNNVPNILNITEDNVFAGEPDDNLDGEEFQDAVQFFKDPSSFQVLENVKTSDLSGANMPRDSLYMTFDPLYKRIIQPTSADMKDNTNFNEETKKEEISDVNCARESLGINLVSFDSPFKNNSDENSEKDSGLNKISVKKEISSTDDVENDQHLVKKHASDVLFPESHNNKLAFDSPMKSNSDGNTEEVSENLKEELLKEELGNVKNTQQLANNILARESLSGNLLSFSSPIKNNLDENFEKVIDLNKKSVKEEICSTGNIENGQHLVIKNASDVHAVPKSLNSALGFYSPIKSSSDENSEKDSGDLNKVSVKEEILEENPQFVKNILTRQSLSGNLLSFDSPVKSNSENVKATLLKNEQKFYTEEEFQQALKIYELTIQEAFLKKQKELEEEALKQGSENTDKFNRMTMMCKVLLETMTEFALVASEQNVKIGELSSRVKNLESENQELDSNLKTSTEDLQSVEHTFSDFHKRYVQCKDMLKTYKDNEDQLKSHIENLSKKLEEQEQMYTMLQAKMEEIVDKSNAEVASAKKGGDAQIAVLKAQLKKSELKVSSLENDLKQTRIDNDKLSSICDDLMAKVSEA